jgi:NADH dehydrogenase
MASMLLEQGVVVASMFGRVWCYGHAMAGHRLLVLGGGFGGLDVVRAIGQSPEARGYWDTLLVDKENFFQFNPLLPAVAVGAVETRHIVYPLREMARMRHVRFHKNKAIRIDLDAKRVELHNDRAESYDTLVIAVGSVTNYFGVPPPPALIRGHRRWRHRRGGCGGATRDGP